MKTPLTRIKIPVAKSFLMALVKRQKFVDIKLSSPKFREIGSPPYGFDRVRFTSGEMFKEYEFEGLITDGHDAHIYLGDKTLEKIVL